MSLQSTLQEPAAASAALTGRRVLILDLIERVLILVIYSYFAYNCAKAFMTAPNIILLPLMLSESLPVAFVLFRAPSASLSTSPFDWGLGIIACVTPLLVNPLNIQHGPVMLMIIVMTMVIGLMLEVAAKVILGRNFGIVAANRGVVTEGPYRFVRHPMYAGYTLVHIGFLLASPSFFNGLVYLTTFVLQVGRILREERILKRDEVYAAFSKRVRYRLVPLIF